MRLAWLLVAVAVLLSGCGAVAKVNHRLMVYALGVDITSEGEYEVFYQVFDSSSGEQSSAPVGANASNVTVLKTKGVSLYECEKNIELQTGKEAFMGDVEMIVLGDSLKGEDLSKLMSYFRNVEDIYLGTDMVFASGSAEDVVNIGKSKSGADPHSLSEILSASVSDSTALSSRVIEVSNAMMASNAVIMPVMVTDTDDEGNPYPKGALESLLIKDGIAVDSVSRDETKGVSLLRGDADMLTVELSVGGYVSSAAVKIKKTKRSVVISDEGYPIIRVSITGELSVTENPSGAQNEVLREMAQREILRFCAEGFEKTAKKHSADVMEIMLLLRKYQPEYYRKMFNFAEEAVYNTQVEVDVSLKIY